MSCLKKGEKASQQLKAHFDFLDNCRPKHARCIEYGEREWFDACNKAFVKVMREVHPEREHSKNPRETLLNTHLGVGSPLAGVE